MTLSLEKFGKNSPARQCDLSPTGATNGGADKSTITGSERGRVSAAKRRLIFRKAECECGQIVLSQWVGNTIDVISERASIG